MNRKTSWPSSVAISLLCVALAGYPTIAQEPSKPPSSQPSDLPWGSAVDNLRLRLVLDKAEYGPMEPMACKLEIQNLGQSPVSVATGTNFVRDYSFSIVSPTGTRERLTLWGEFRSKMASESHSSGAPIGPGLSHDEYIHAINRAFDMTLEGNYSMVVRFRMRSPLDSDKWIELTSNEGKCSVKAN